MSIRSFVRPNLRSFQSYSSAGKSSARTGVLLDANELPSSLLSGADGYNRYPHPLSIDLRVKLAELHGVSVDQVFIGNGSDEVFDLLQRAFGIPGIDSIVTLPPTFGMYAVSAQLNDLIVHAVPLRSDDFTVAEAQLLSTIANQKPKLVFLCSPNNPTGNQLSCNLIRAVCSAMRSLGLVVLDEAYIDFAAEPSGLHLLAEQENLVIVRTLSKSWGLAGLRLGYCLASSEIIEILDAIKPPYNINSASCRLALEVLIGQHQQIQMIEQVKEQRSEFRKFLDQQIFVEHVFPSEANFVLVKVRSADELYEYCLERGLVIRNRTRDLHCNNCVRISIGLAEDMGFARNVLTEYACKVYENN